MIQCYINITLLISFFNIPERLDHRFQWIRPIDDRFYLPRLNQLFEQGQVFELIAAVALLSV